MLMLRHPEVVIMAGLLATIAMSLFMSAITRSGLADGDMIRALGSVFTRNLDNAFMVGFVVQLVGGIVFAFIYCLIWQQFSFRTVPSYVFAGLSTGFVHGFAISFSLIVAVAEWHPLERFRRAGFRVALVHVLGHCLYGAVLGFILGLAFISPN